MATRSDESMKGGYGIPQQESLPMGDRSGESDGGDVSGAGSKRGVPESTEKVSPEKKLLRTDLPSPPIEPRQLQLDNVSVTADDRKKESPQLPKPVSPQALPSPSPVPVPTETSQPDVLASLQKALDKIEKLEIELEHQKNKQLGPVVSETTPNRGLSGTPSSAITSKTGALDDGSDSDENGNEAEGSDLMKFPNGQKLMTHDALRMRLRRLCEVKAKSKKCHVDSETAEQYRRGGEGREWLEIALVEALQKVGPDSRQHKKLRVPHL